MSDKFCPDICDGEHCALEREDCDHVKKIDVDKDWAKLNGMNRYQQIRSENYGMIVIDDMSHYMTRMKLPFDADAEKAKANVKTNKENDLAQKKMLAMEIYNSLKEDQHMIYQVCGSLGIRTHGNDLTCLKNEIYEIAINDGHERDRHGLINVDKFISIVGALKKDFEKPVSYRYAYMVDEYVSKNVHKDFRKSHGEGWAQKARDYTKVLKMDFHLSDHFSSTLLDENTILIFPRNYKKPEPEIPYWDEDDLVVSQLM